MCLKKIKGVFNKYRDRLRDFCVSTTAGVFSGIAIGFLLNNTAQIEFKGFINPITYGILPFIIKIIIPFIIIGLILYFIGKSVVYYGFNIKNKSLSFYLSYVTGAISCLFSSSIMLVRDIYSLITIGVMFVILFLILAFLTIRIKWKD